MRGSVLLLLLLLRRRLLLLLLLVLAGLLLLLLLVLLLLVLLRAVLSSGRGERGEVVGGRHVGGRARQAQYFYCGLVEFSFWLGAVKDRGGALARVCVAAASNAIEQDAYHRSCFQRCGRWRWRLRSTGGLLSDGMRAAELGVNGDGRRGRDVVDLGTPGVCAQVRCLSICQCAPGTAGPQKSRAVAGAEECSKIKEPTEPTRAMRCAGSNI